MAARSEPQDGVFGEQPLGRLEATEPESLVGMVERQLELPPAARVHSVLRFRRKPQPHLPEELTAGEPGDLPFPYPHQTLDHRAPWLGAGAARQSVGGPRPAPLVDAPLAG